MPNVSAEKLIEIAKSLLVAAGASEEEAAVIARYNIGANLVGHDSHGIILIPTYIDRIKAGHIVPQAPWVITQETADHNRHRRQLGLWLRGHRPGDALHDRKGEDAERRRRHGVPPKPYRPPRQLPAARRRPRA